MPWASLVQPPLSTVQLPAYDLGVTAATLLQERIGDSDKPLQTVVPRTALHRVPARRIPPTAEPAPECA